MPARIRRLLALTSLLILLIARSGEGPPPPYGPPNSEVLARTIPEVRFDGTPLLEAVHQLAREARVQLEVNWSQRYPPEVEPSSSLTLHLRNLPLEKVLRLAFQAASESPRAPTIGFIDEGNARIRIALSSDLPTTVTRAYDLTWLLPSPARDPIRSSAYADPTWTARDRDAEILVQRVQEVVDSGS